jgi:hypothetical protein
MAKSGGLSAGEEPGNPQVNTVGQNPIDAFVGARETPYGPSPTGFLTYGADGRVTALISYDGRKGLSLGGGTLDEQAEAFKTFLAYAGRYVVSGDTVTHYVEISSIQNYVDRELVRNVEFQGDQIILVTPPTRVNGKIQTVELIWQRLSEGC